MIALAEDLPVPVAAAVSVVTIGELYAGVLLASSSAVRALRQRRLVAVEGAFRPISVDLQVARRYGGALALARSTRRTAKATDLLIIATALATGRQLVTRDRSQAGLAEAAGVEVSLA